MAADLRVAPGSAEAEQAEVASIVQWRREHQPGGSNAGSVFTNPPGDSAGRLIDEAGLKGFGIGTAHVSEKHANFIQAERGGRADDVRAVMEHVRGWSPTAAGSRSVPRSAFSALGAERLVACPSPSPNPRRPTSPTSLALGRALTPVEAPTRGKGAGTAAEGPAMAVARVVGTAKAGARRAVVAGAAWTRASRPGGPRSSGRRASAAFASSSSGWWQPRSLGGWFLLHSPLFSASAVTVTGNTHESTAQVIDQAGLASQPALLDVDAGAVTTRLEQLPWVRSASVNVSWPDGVHISVVEETPRLVVSKRVGSGPP